MKILNNFFDGDYLEIKETGYSIKFKVEKIPEGFIIRGKIKGFLNKIELFEDNVEEELLINNWQSWGVTKKINILNYKIKKTDEWKNYMKYIIHPMPEYLEKNIISDYFLGKKNKLYGFLSSKIAHPYFEIKNNKIIACLEYFGKYSDDYIDMEPLIILENKKLEKLLEIYADYVKFELKPRFFKWNPKKWFSEYQYFEKLTWEDVIKKLELLKEYNYEIFQLDNSWQEDIGDWIPKKTFPTFNRIVEKIKKYGYKSGLWLAPFSVSETSTIFQNHRDWLVKNKDGNPKIVYFNFEKNIYALDVTHPEVQIYLHNIFKKMKEYGIHYFKIDFLFSGAVSGKRYLNVTPIEAYNIGMKIIREATNGDFLLGSGSPLLPSIGYVDGMQISTNIIPISNLEFSKFTHLNSNFIFNNIITRHFMNGKWWWNASEYMNIDNKKLDKNIIEMYLYILAILNNTSIQNNTFLKEMKRNNFNNLLDFRNNISYVGGFMNNNIFHINSYDVKWGNIKMEINLNKMKYHITYDENYPKLNKKTVINKDKRLFHYYEESDNNA
ncbi:alpha-galactosidase [Marinitoga hydrogenitolerans DSM 16785]|uniref:Alpha-galactosidase n=1 Tax=Marinitoga hydrogenitolerans (strain DSM 16785 / JCM 12826 / AT1271) TaxID=1122195 RepID=A0A1M4SGI0_MARH1|nr:alpha-galactosidase [Marinitoga hydrogenitolerans]SHE31310.1 alpha-galactosidase [Marinitoga hydrogenitolerans DSM 16785]